MRRAPLKPFRWDAVIKVGGSLGRGSSLRPLLRKLAALARHRRIMIVPGGGVFADLVRAEKRRLRLREGVAHRMALRAMDQYGLLLASLCPGARAVADLAEASRAARAGKMPVLLAGARFDQEKGLERTFRLTSDSISALLATRVRPSRLLLLKSFTTPTGKIRSRATSSSMARLGVVDPLFPETMPSGTEVWILDGRLPAALDRVLRKRRTVPQRSAAVRPRSASWKAARRRGSRRP